jgi:hypothetical protein
VAPLPHAVLDVDPVWHPTAFTTNRDRLLAGDVATKSLAAVLSHPRVRRLLSRAPPLAPHRARAELVDCLQRLMPALGGRDDRLGIGLPQEGLGRLVMMLAALLPMHEDLSASLNGRKLDLQRRFDTI